MTAGAADFEACPLGVMIVVNALCLALLSER